jgi:hypothetical protein
MCLLLEYCAHKQYRPNECNVTSVVFSPIRIKIGRPSCRRFSSSKISWISCIDSGIMMVEVTRNGSTKLMTSFVTMRRLQTRGYLCCRAIHLGDVNSSFNDNVQFRSCFSLPQRLMKRSCD